MARAARSIHLARGDARQANVRTFCAPDRPVAVIDSRGCAVERLASGDDGSSEQERDNHPARSEEHTSELQSLMRISYAVFCLKKKKHNRKHTLTPTLLK